VLSDCHWHDDSVAFLAAKAIAAAKKSIVCACGIQKIYFLEGFDGRKAAS
jgi:hypothetical protein